MPALTPAVREIFVKMLLQDIGSASYKITFKFCTCVVTQAQSPPTNKKRAVRDSHCGLSLTARVVVWGNKNRQQGTTVIGYLPLPVLLEKV
jgi:hypothetical protein